MVKMIVAREFEFDSAHKLEWYDGKCKDLHGHTYRLQVFVKEEVNKQGVVIDFYELNNMVKQFVVDLLDHKYLNEIIENPTAENICVWIWSELKDRLNGLFEIKLWENSKSFVIYRGGR
jgi:6-pyruvoyltetrahydropterin/6-carboxytetrahydropterin synthase